VVASDDNEGRVQVGNGLDQRCTRRGCMGRRRYGTGADIFGINDHQVAMGQGLSCEVRVLHEPEHI